MKMTKLLGALTFCGFAALMSCDTEGTPTTSGLADTDCPVGMFRPPGLADCVFPADDMFGGPLAVTDNRCATGQPAFPPACVSDHGGRRYFSMTKTCAPDYRFEPGTCQRDNTGFAGTGGGFPITGTAGASPPFTGAAGEVGTGFGAIGGTDPSGQAGSGAGADSGSAGAGGSTGVAGS